MRQCSTGAFFFFFFFFLSEPDFSPAFAEDPFLGWVDTDGEGAGGVVLVNDVAGSCRTAPGAVGVIAVDIRGCVTKPAPGNGADEGAACCGPG